VLKRSEGDSDERWIKMKDEWVERWSEGEKLVGKLLEKSNRENLGEDVSYLLVGRDTRESDFFGLHLLPHKMPLDVNVLGSLMNAFATIHVSPEMQ